MTPLTAPDQDAAVVGDLEREQHRWPGDGGRAGRLEMPVTTSPPNITAGSRRAPLGGIDDPTTSPMVTTMSRPRREDAGAQVEPAPDGPARIGALVSANIWSISKNGPDPPEPPGWWWNADRQRGAVHHVAQVDHRRRDHEREPRRGGGEGHRRELRQRRRTRQVGRPRHRGRHGRLGDRHAEHERERDRRQGQRDHVARRTARRPSSSATRRDRSANRRGRDRAVPGRRVRSSGRRSSSTLRRPLAPAPRPRCGRTMRFDARRRHDPSISQRPANCARRQADAALRCAPPHRCRPQAGRVIEPVESHGKHLEIEWDDGLVLDTHMRMSGSSHLYRHGDKWRRPYRQMRRDPGRRLGGGLLQRTERSRRTGEPTVVGTRHGRLVPICARPTPSRRVGQPAADRSPSRRRLGRVLLDQRVMCGVGNVYRCEVLWATE